MMTMTTTVRRCCAPPLLAVVLTALAIIIAPSSYCTALVVPATTRSSLTPLRSSRPQFSSARSLSSGSSSGSSSDSSSSSSDSSSSSSSSSPPSSSPSEPPPKPANACQEQLWAAGWNRYGEFGNGEISVGNINPTPVVIGTFRYGIRDIHVGAFHSAIVNLDGSAWTAGRGDFGQLGHGDTDRRSAFTKVEGISNIIKAAGYWNTFFITDGGGEVFATGKNEHGQLAVGDTDDRDSPVKIPITGVMEVAAGETHTLFLKRDGSVYAAGNNAYGQLCVDNNVQYTSPVLIGSLTDIVAIAAGSHHSVFLKGDGSAWSCGRNDEGQLGVGDNDNRDAPAQVSGIAQFVTSIAASYRSTAFLLFGGTVRSTGRNNDGELGIGDSNERNVPATVPINGVKEIHGATGGSRFFFVRNDGTVFSTGDNLQGELGVGDTSDKNVPVEVNKLSDEGVSSVAGGESFTFFVAGDPCDKPPSWTPAKDNGDTTALFTDAFYGPPPATSSAPLAYYPMFISLMGMSVLGFWMDCW